MIKKKIVLLFQPPLLRVVLLHRSRTARGRTGSAPRPLASQRTGRRTRRRQIPASGRRRRHPRHHHLRSRQMAIAIASPDKGRNTSHRKLASSLDVCGGHGPRCAGRSSRRSSSYRRSPQRRFQHARMPVPAKKRRGSSTLLAVPSKNEIFSAVPALEEAGSSKNIRWFQQ